MSELDRLYREQSEAGRAIREHGGPTAEETGARSDGWLRGRWAEDLIGEEALLLEGK